MSYLLKLSVLVITIGGKFASEKNKQRNKRQARDTAFHNIPRYLLCEGRKKLCPGKLLMMSQWCLVKWHCLASDPFVSALCSSPNERQERLEWCFRSSSFFHFLFCTVNSCLHLRSALSLGIGRPDLAEESMLEWGCAAGGSPLMGTPWEPDAKAAVGSQMWQLSCNS